MFLLNQYSADSPLLQMETKDKSLPDLKWAEQRAAELSDATATTNDWRLHQLLNVFVQTAKYICQHCKIYFFNNAPLSNLLTND